jgi:hypothetical protein
LKFLSERDIVLLKVRLLKKRRLMDRMKEKTQGEVILVVLYSLGTAGIMFLSIQGNNIEYTYIQEDL